MLEGVACACRWRAWLTHIKTDTIAYPACTLQYNGKQCNKKVAEGSSGDGPGQWYCDRCTAHCQAEWRYMLNLRLEDHTGTEWVTAFQVRRRTGLLALADAAARCCCSLKLGTIVPCRTSPSWFACASGQWYNVEFVLIHC